MSDSEQELLTKINAEITDSLGYDGEISEQREKAQEYYYALPFGNEVDGVQQDVVNHCDGAIEIPQLGTKHSLNISVSAGIVLWDVFRKIKNWKN